jgi:diguanylate cyclase (GGDEF)-like protein
VAGAGAAGGSLIVCDVDNFKRINDVLGYETGDAVLAGIAEVLAATVTDGGVAARLGGEEFALVLPGCDADEAVVRAEQLRLRVLQRSTHWPAPVTVSVGCATGTQGTEELVGLLDRADRALYAAKAAGRNTVRSSRPASYDVV